MVARHPADIVLRNGIIFIAGPTTSRNSLAVAGGRIVYTGPDDGLKPWIGPETEVIDLAGNMVLPGFHDSHLHPIMGGIDLIECCLTGLSSQEEYLAKVRDYALKNSDRSCIKGSGWRYTCFPAPGPDKKILDAVIPDRPVYLKSIDGHTAWVNSRALELAGIKKALPDPAGGHIERDPATEEPTGTLRELSAMHLVEDILPQPTREECLAGAQAFMEQAVRFGITSIYDAMAVPEYLETYAELDRSGELSLRVSAALVCNPESGIKQVAEIEELRSKYSGNRLLPVAVKFFLDGVIESHTAFLLEPYTDRPDLLGEPIWDEKTFQQLTAALDRKGFQIHLHAIGDAAVHMALDGLEYAVKVNGRRNSRHQIAHLDMVSDQDIPRFRELGVIANFQPAWFYKDTNFSNSTLPFLGEKRAHQLYRMQSMLDAGAIIVCGSDWPVGGELITLNPLDAIQIGVTRLGLQRESDDIFTPGERVNRWSMIDFYTIHGAYAHFQDKETGSLEVGKYADLIVLDRNLFEVPVPEIHKAKVLLTLLEGKTVFRDPSL